MFAGCTDRIGCRRHDYLPTLALPKTLAFAQFSPEKRHCVSLFRAADHSEELWCAENDSGGPGECAPRTRDTTR